LFLSIEDLKQLRASSTFSSSVRRAHARALAEQPGNQPRPVPELTCNSDINVNVELLLQ
jgi:hypothetical protein